MATRTAAPTVYPAPAGCAAHERGDWLPAGLGLDWLEELRALHVEHAQTWARAVTRLGDLRADVRARELEHRRVVQQALAAGEELPPRPTDLDPARLEAQLSLALEEANEARDELSMFVMGALASLRSHRVELRPHLASLSAALLNAISAGSADQRSIVAERLRRQAAEVEATAIETIADDEKEPTHV